TADRHCSRRSCANEHPYEVRTQRNASSNVCANQIALNIDAIEITEKRQTNIRISGNKVASAGGRTADCYVGWFGSYLAHFNTVSRGAVTVSTFAIRKCLSAGYVRANKISLHQVVCGAGVENLNSRTNVSRNDVPRSSSCSTDCVVGRSIDHYARGVGNFGCAADIRADEISQDQRANAGGHINSDTTITGDDISGAGGRSPDRIVTGRPECVAPRLN